MRRPTLFLRQLFFFTAAVAVLSVFSGAIFILQANADIFDNPGSVVQVQVNISSNSTDNGPSSGLVPCGNPDQPMCQPCHIVVLLINLMGFAMKTIVPAAFVLMFLYAGILMFISMGSPDTWSKVRKIIINTIIGTLIVFGGYFIVDTLIKVLTGDLNSSGFRDLGPWNTPRIVGSCGIANAQPAPAGDFGRGVQTTSSAVTNIANLLAVTVMGVSVIMVLYAAYLFISARGDSEQISKARKALLWALVGIAIALIAFAVPAFISGALGS